MKLISTGGSTSSIEDYIESNQLPATKVNLYDTSLDTYGRFNLDKLPPIDDPKLLIIDYKTFYSIVAWHPSKNQLVNFANSNNQIWVWNDADSTLGFLYQLDNCLEFNQLANNNVTWFLDAPFADSIQFKTLEKIYFELIPNSAFLKTAPRIIGATVNKQHCKKDFLLTTIKKKDREHRDYLWSEIIDRPGLVERGHAYYKKRNDPWVGDYPIHHNWPDGHVSMDLYLDAWLEIVPETMYKDAYFITEKTVKPIATRTPFLILTTPGYLKYLRNNGFKTFDSLISEKYNEQDNIVDQARMLVDQLESIVDNGAEEFYHACSAILYHNQQQLFEINGSWQFHMDQFIHKKFQGLGIS